MTSLTDTQAILLGAAARRDDRRIIRPPRLRGTSGDNVFAAMLKRGLIAQATFDEPQAVIEANAVAGLTDYVATCAGLAALGLDDEEPVERREAVSIRASDADAVVTPEHCSTSPACGSVHRNADRTPRAGSKVDQLIAMLREPEGATLDALAQALGWLPHTTRAALTRLRQQGYVLDRGRDSQGRSAYRIVSGDAP